MIRPGNLILAGGLALVLAAAGSAAAPAPAHASAAASPSSQSFAFNDTTQYFTVPAGVHSVHLLGLGGSGGQGGYGPGQYPAPGGLGAQLSLDAPVSPGDTLVIEVGGKGGNASGGGNGNPMQNAGAGANSSGSGQNGGPAGNINFYTDGSAGGGGGGGTVVVDAATGTTLLDAGGGGGAGGGLNGGQAGTAFSGGPGGSAGSPVNGGCTPTYGDGYNGAGTVGGSSGGLCDQPGTGPAGISGSGETPLAQSGTSGGGGGGATGGTGGGNSSFSSGGGGAAGTSAWAPTDTGVTVSNAPPGDGSVAVSWTTLPAFGFAHTMNFPCCTTQTFTVPAGVTQLHVTAWGATGGSGGYSATYPALYAPLGGFGAEISLDTAVTPGDQLVVDPGGRGADGAFANQQTAAIAAGNGGSSAAGQAGGAGGAVTVNLGNRYSGGTGGGGGGGTDVVDQTAANKVLLDSGGGGGGGGDYPSTGNNGGFGADAGSPVATGTASLGNGYPGSGPDIRGSVGGSFAPAGNTPSGSDGTSSNAGSIGTGGGGGGGSVGGGGGGLCQTFNNGGCSSGGGAGGGAGNSSWTTGATNVVLSNSLAGDGGVTISWVARLGSATSVTSKVNPAVAGEPVTLTATVTAPDAPSSYTPTGNVTFIDYETGLPIGLPVTLGSTSPYTASTTVTSLPVGTDHVYATYSGDPNFVPSTSSMLAESVTKGVAVTTTQLPDATAGAPYHATLAAAGGTQPYHWKIASGSLPAGLTLGATTGNFAGTPTTTGTFAFTVGVTDSTTPTPVKAIAQLRITVNPKIQPAVYVVNGASSAVHSYALGASGNVAPLSTLAGATTGLNGTSAVTIGRDGRVFVASANNQSIREYPYGATGDVLPEAVIAGADTGLASPSALALDGQGRLYVANAAANSVTVYASGATGDAKPIATLTGPHTGLANPTALTIDGHGLLWVANLAANSLTAYPASADGDLAPSLTIAGFATRLNGPQGLVLDSTGNLLVADTYDNSITEYSATATGNVLPLRRIAGPSTGLSFPIGIDIDAAGNLYVSNQYAGIEEFSFPANGDRTPLASIEGSATGLSAPGRLAVAPPLSVATKALPPARLHKPYHARLRAYLGTTPYDWSVTKGHLPPGLRLREGSISGRPLRAGTYRFTVSVRDASHPRMRASRRLTIAVRR